MSVPPNLARLSTTWVDLETDPAMLEWEIEQTENRIALYAADLNAGDAEACDGDLDVCRRSIAYAKEVLNRLYKQVERLGRARLPHPVSPPTRLEDLRPRMERAKALDPYLVLCTLGEDHPRQTRNGDYWVECPLPGHDEDTPSFHMRPDGRWKCFGCGRGGGDVVSFAAAMLMTNQLAGLVYLEEQFGL